MFFFILLLTVCFCACGEQDKKDSIPLDAYYFPLDELKDGLVYQYNPVNNDSFPPYFWLYRSLIQDGKQYLLGQYYDHNFEIKQLSREEVVENGVIMVDYAIYETVDEKQIRIPGKVISPTVFPYEIIDTNAIFLFKIELDVPGKDSVVNTLIRNRQFNGYRNYNFKSKPQDCISLMTKELIDNYDNGHLEYEFLGEEYYAKNLGLIYFRKDITENLSMAYELVDTFSVSSFEERFKIQTAH